MFQTYIKFLKNIFGFIVDGVIEKNPVDFFATGISYTEVGLDFNCFPKVHGVNLACSSQDLRQGYLTAKYFFEHAPKKIKFVIIGISPYSLNYDNSNSFAVYPRELQFIWTLKNFKNHNPPPLHITFLDSLVSDAAKKTFSNVTEEQADLSNANVRNHNNNNFPANAIIDWQEDFKFIVKKFYPETFEKNLQILENYIELCIENGAKAVAVNFPFAPIIRENYPQETLAYFRHLLKQFEKIYDFKFVDLFDLPLDYSCFYNGTHLNLKGSYLASSVLAYNLFEENILSAENFRETDQNFFNALAALIPKDKYENFKKKIFPVNGDD